MAFLDNSGDIILDAVLTDTGRLRLAQGDGSFKISKFALGDDEINYTLYNKNHASGSAYYDLEVLQTPVLEAFTNNTSNLKSKLLSISRTNVLYMPILKVAKVPFNDGTYLGTNKKQYGPSDFFSRYDPEQAEGNSSERFYVAVDEATYKAMTGYRDDHGSTSTLTNDTFKRTGILKGYVGGAWDPGQRDIIRVDQGLDTNEISPELGIDTDLYESAYIVEMDYRLGRVASSHPAGGTAAVNFIDDDNIAQYYLTSQGETQSFINPYGSLDGASTTLQGGTTATKDKTALDGIWTQAFEGPRGSTLHFSIFASQELNSSTYLFTQLGSSEDSDSADNLMAFPEDGNDLLVANKTTYYIDTTIRVIGANTGYRLDIPIRYVKIK